MPATLSLGGRRPRPARAAALRTGLALTVMLLGGCTVKTSVQVTATTPANVTHLYVTVKELWFTAQSGATPADSQWTKKVLSDPVTIDLASLNGGTVQTVGSSTLLGGGYAQMRLVLADAGGALASSAGDLGLDWNNAVEYVDNAGASHLVPLELANPDGSLLIPLSIKLRNSAITGGSSTADTATVVVDIDALRSLIVFDYDGEAAAILDPGLQAYDNSKVGTITGTFDLSAISSTAIGGDRGIIVSAEAADATGQRHYIVKSTRLGGGGSFTLSPLPEDDAGAYDIVVHGPGVQTLVVTGVTLQAGKTTTLQDSNITLPASQSFLVNTATAVPGGTVAGFYQTPPDSLPYLIDFAAVNPIGGGFSADLALASAHLMYGAYNGGSAISFTDSVAEEGAATYGLAANSRWRAPSGFVTVTGASGGSNTAQTVTLPQPGLPDGAIAGTISGTVSFPAAGRYDSLYVIVSRGGRIVDAVDVSSAIAGKAFVNFSVTNVPAGTANTIYDVSVRAWASRNPASTLVRATFATQADLRQGDAGGLSLQL